jgi:hypothetical protein
MRCPVCSAKVLESAASCSTCGTSFVSGEWKPVAEPSQRVSYARLFTLVVLALVFSGLATALTRLAVEPPVVGDGGHTSLFWVLTFGAGIAEYGGAIFLAYLALALVAIAVYALRKGVGA